MSTEDTEDKSQLHKQDTISLDASENESAVSGSLTSDVSSVTMLERYAACMILSGTGDALGYKNGEFEFCNSGNAIHKQVAAMGGIDKIVVKLPTWMISDDTVMHLATADALIEHGESSNFESLYRLLAKYYKSCMKDMTGRAPGNMCLEATSSMNSLLPKGYKTPFKNTAGGCGAAMRSMCIGLRYPQADKEEDLIRVSVESGRMTHHHPTGYLGSLAGALFTAYAIRGKPIRSWGMGLINTLPRALAYIVKRGEYVKENKAAWNYFEEKWTSYLEPRGLMRGNSQSEVTEKQSVADRDKLYKSWSFSGWAGSSGHDAPLIAYDAILAAGKNWSELCSRAMFHSGDSDSTGVMAAAWFGASYGFTNVNPNNYQELEYVDRLRAVASKLYTLSGEFKSC